MKKDQTRQKLIDSTIHVIASEGLDKATTKRIGTHADLNEVYIYRCFADKEDMFAQAFNALDDELVEKATQYFDVLTAGDMNLETRARLYFDAIWSFLLGGSEKCKTYIRYYYSSYFLQYSAELHKQRFVPLVQKFSRIFKEEADVWMILNHVFNILFDFALKVHNNQMPEDDNYSEHVFRVIYASIQQYFKNHSEELS